MFDKIYQPQWMSLDKKTREHLSKVFSIPQSGITEIRDDMVLSDGKTNGDLSAINEFKMSEYVGSKESYPRLWELTLAKCKYELDPPVVEIGVGVIETAEPVEVIAPLKVVKAREYVKEVYKKKSK